LLIAGLAPGLDAFHAKPSGANRGLTLVLGTVMVNRHGFYARAPDAGACGFFGLLLTDPMDEGLWKIALSCGPSRRRTGQAFADWRLVLLVELLIWRQWPLAGNVALGILLGANLGRHPPCPAGAHRIHDADVTQSDPCGARCKTRSLVGLQRICPKRVTACDLP